MKFPPQNKAMACVRMSYSNSPDHYNNDRKYLGFVEIINILDNEQPETQKDVTEMSFALRWIGMEVKSPHLNLTEDQLKSTVDKVNL